MRTECPKCQYGTSLRGKNKVKRLRSHYRVTGHNKTAKVSKVGLTTLGKGAKK